MSHVLTVTVQSFAGNCLFCYYGDENRGFITRGQFLSLVVKILLLTSSSGRCLMVVEGCVSRHLFVCSSYSSAVDLPSSVRAAFALRMPFKERSSPAVRLLSFSLCSDRSLLAVGPGEWNE